MGTVLEPNVHQTPEQLQHSSQAISLQENVLTYLETTVTITNFITP